jgi:tRNA pseudouridine38-40 synthase
MQVNPNARTIEQELHKAFAETGAVSKDNAFEPHKIDFMRAARTDKGVHALGQVVSLKMIVSDPDIKLKLNNALPDQIRIWDIVRTTNSFHAKNACNSRIYEYLLPTYVLQQPDPLLYPRSKLALDSGLDVTAAVRDLSLLTPDQITDIYSTKELPKATPEQVQDRRKYRITPDKLQQLKTLLKTYQGTHNFHNYTIRKNFSEASSKRYIMSFDCSEPFQRHGIEWVTLTIHGQSFMLHQIRKMVGFAVLCIRTNTSPDIIPETFRNIKINIPKAPALGLLLQQTVYKGYNEKWCDEASGRSPVTFEPHLNEMNAFKEEYIYKTMYDTELDTNEYEEWCRGVDAHHMEFEWYLTHDSKIDPTQKPPHIMNKKVGDDENEDKEDDE